MTSRLRYALFSLLITLFICCFLYVPQNNSAFNLTLACDFHSQEEVDFPLAYSISVYKDAAQLLTLLTLIYRPFNLYCVHVDKKSEESVQRVVLQLTKKYHNVIVPQHFIEVVHSKFSVLESELLCMEALMKYGSIEWRYVINLTGQELPLKSNLELVRILKQLKGANLVEKKFVNKGRIPNHLGPPPHGIRLWKGAIHIIVVRDFVKFALNDERSQNLLKFLKKTLVPDETFFSTLNHEHSLRAPGGYSGNLLTDLDAYPFLNRHKIWKTQGTCHGRYVRGICIFFKEDVPEMTSVENKKLFANKFIMGVNNLIYDFMVEWFLRRQKLVYSNLNVNPFINLTYYSKLTVVRNHF